MTGIFPNQQVVSVAARHIERARLRAAQFAIRADTVEELLADPQIEMAVILTLVGTHYDLIRQALLAGKHVYTEKTIADSLDKARELHVLEVLATLLEVGKTGGFAPVTSGFS